MADTHTATRGRLGNACQSPHGSVSVTINLGVNGSNADTGNNVHGSPNGDMMLSPMSLVSKIVIFIQCIAAMQFVMRDVH